MCTEDSSLFLARKQVHEYRDKDDELMSRHQEAMECRDCEDFLDLGIKAQERLSQADRILRQAAVEGLDVSAEIRNALADLYRVWLCPCEHAEKWAAEQKSRGYIPRNLDVFIEARKVVERQIRLLEMEEHLESAFQGGVFDNEFWSEAKEIRST